MEIEIEDRKENKLLNREEIKCTLKYEGKTPERQKIREEIKNAIGKDGFVVLQYIKQKYGENKAKIYAKIYPSEAEARKIEPSYIIARNLGIKEEKKKEEKKGEKK
ncbi:MAG: 30S ribosomal protein S24e [Candidatus Thermoplasmatota archaeon]